jgi:thymidylate synthase
MGIRYSYGDLGDVVDLLHLEPMTRQAYIPLFFPEDTGVGDGGRKPCTLGYQFIMRHEMLHIYYPLRSCDFANHFADDVYLAVRLLLWILNQLRQRDERWTTVAPGTLTIHATSLHMFINDYHQMVK